MNINNQTSTDNSICLSAIVPIYGVEEYLEECIESIINQTYKNLEIILTEGERYGNGRMGSVKGVLLKNVRWANAGKPFTLVGHPTRFVEDITFEDCYVGGRKITCLKDADFQAEYVKGLNFIPGGPAVVERHPKEPYSGRVPGQRNSQWQGRPRP